MTSSWTLIKQKLSIREMWESSLKRNALYLMINSISASAFGFIFWIIIARYYSSVYGELEADVYIGLAITVISTVSLLSLIASLGFEIGLIRYLPQSKPSRFKSMVNSCFSVTIILSIILGSIFLLGLPFWAPDLIFLLDSPLWIISVLLFVAIWTISGLLTNIFVAARGAKYVLIKDSIIIGILKIIFAILLVSFASVGIFSSFIIATLFSFIIGIFFFLPKLQPGYSFGFSINKKLISEIFSFSFSNHIATLLSATPVLLFPLLITNILSASNTAYFFIALAISGMISKASLSVATSLFAEGSRNEGKFLTDLKSSMAFSFTLLIPLIIIIIIFGEDILSLFGSGYSDNGYATLQLLSLSAIPITINTFYITMKRIQKKTNVIIMINAFIAISLLSLGYILINDLGLIGLAWAILITRSTVTIAILPSLIKNILINR